MAEKRKAGRPSAYTEAIADAICDRIAAGESMRRICSADGMPDRSTVLRWLAEREDFATKCARARELQADAVDDEIVEMLGEVKTGTLDPQAARVLLAGYQWRASKLAPKRYGDKTVHTGPDGEGPMRVEVAVKFG